MTTNDPYEKAEQKAAESLADDLKRAMREASDRVLESMNKLAELAPDKRHDLHEEIETQIRAINGWRQAIQHQDYQPSLPIKPLATLGEDSADRPWLLMEPEEPRALLDAQDEHGRNPTPAIPQGEVCLLIAPGGTGKTWALLELAIAMVVRGSGGRGKFPWFGRYVVRKEVPADVLVIMGETSEASAKRRLQVLVQRMFNGAALTGMDAARVAQSIGSHIHLLTLHGNPTGLPELVAQLMNDNHSGLEYGAVIVDPLARFSMADNENDNKGATETVAMLETLTKLPGNPSIFVSHHVNKSALKEEGNLNVSSVRGASGLVDGARCVLALSPKEELEGTKVVQLHTIKLNDMAHSASPLMIWDERHNAGYRVMTSAEQVSYQTRAEATPTTPNRKSTPSDEGIL